MIDFRKMDDKDFVFINKRLSENEDKAFSEFLKNRKARSKRKKVTRKSKKIHVN